MIHLKKTNNLNEAKNLIPPPQTKLVNVLSWHDKDTKYFELSPYFLKTEDGVLFENYWQKMKVYDFVYDIEVYPHYSFKGNEKYLWWRYKCNNNKGKEMHYNKENDEIMPEYFLWRKSINNVLNQ